MTQILIKKDAYKCIKSHHHLRNISIVKSDYGVFYVMFNICVIFIHVFVLSLPLRAPIQKFFTHTVLPFFRTVHEGKTLIKKRIKFSSYIRKFRVEQLQSHIWLTASSYIGKYLPISSYIRKPFLIYDFVTAPLWISPIYEENLIFFFISAPRRRMTVTSSLYEISTEQLGKKKRNKNP